MRVLRESKRGCGYRKPGGLYLVADGPGRPCGRLPAVLDVCPCCGGGIKPSRGWTWVDGRTLLKTQHCEVSGRIASPPHGCIGCPLRDPLGDEWSRCGLLWIGTSFYKTPEDWTKEANQLGVSRRIPAVPKEFKVKETWVLMAHRQGASFTEDGEEVSRPAIVHVFRPSRVEYVVKGDETEEKLERLRKRGVEPVKVIPIKEES